MTLYQRKSFTVPASGEGKREDCTHGWVNKGKCVLCGMVPDGFQCGNCSRWAPALFNGICRACDEAINPHLW